MLNTRNENIIDYKGTIDFNTIGEIIRDFKEVSSKVGMDISTFKRVLSATVETLENVYKYADSFNENMTLNEKFPVVFSIDKNQDSYLVEVGNPVLYNHVQPLKDKIDYLNGLDIGGKKELYKEIVKNGQFSRKGGAGLGLIEIAKICSNIDYEFKQIDEEFTYYKIKIKVDKH